MEREILSRLYDTTKERATSTEYNQLRKEFEEKKEKFLGKVGEEYREQLEHLTDIIYEMDSILSKEDFCNRILNSSIFIHRKYI